MKHRTHIADDPGLRLTPLGRRVAWVIIGLVLAGSIYLILTDLLEASPDQTARPATFSRAPARICTAWRWDCTSYRSVFGLQICRVWRITCTSYVQTGKVAGLAASAAGNRGGCGHNNRNMRYGLTCNVSDAGPGFVSGICAYGYWFSRVSTSRTFSLDQALIVDGCEGIGSELYAPITIRKAR